MITTDAYFDNIREVIKKELLMAKRSVYAAIAWFTDKNLFNALLQLQEQGVHVEICIIQDDINFHSGGLPFTKLNNQRGKFFTAPNDNMHHKFCVIDESVVITGSYNWTNRAATSKNENITITTGDYNLANNFINEFYKITKQTKAFVPEVDINKLIKRCNAVLQLIKLEEIEDIHRQAKRMENESSSMPQIYEITQLLLSNKLEQAIEKMNLFISEYQQLQVYADPKIDALKFEIKLLEYQIIAVENEKADAEKIIIQYDYLYNEVLGETVKKYLYIKKRLAQYKHKESPNNEANKQSYKEAQKDYEEYTHSYEESKQKNRQFKNIGKDEKIILKKLFREASMLCHPDKFSNEPEKYAKAEAIFKELNNANINQDIERVNKILQNLNQGYFDNISTINEKQENLEQLKFRLTELQKKYEAVIEEINFIKQGKAYKAMNKYADIKEYFNQLKSDIEQQIQKLEEELLHHE